ncbi:MAG TPA: 16S rRNA (guanine(966)-N(2))-methyltransferase RsmD [Candidatus Koribacter sp.]|jgi:16S rRNA (guanine(966)-N(2))-methyltransferase RsmD
MRIIAGKFRSRPLKTPQGLDVRPSSDRLRETLFNVLTAGYELENSRWIDLFAGTGAVGLEALSRGAGYVYFVEKVSKVARVTEANISSVGASDQAQILTSDVLAGLRQLEGIDPVEFVFLDPPYREEGAYLGVLRILSESPVLKQGSIVIAEHTKHFDPGDGVGKLTRYRSLKQGDAVLSFYKRAT